MANKTLTHKGTGRKVTVPDDQVKSYTDNGWEEVKDGTDASEGSASTRKTTKRGADAKG